MHSVILICDSPFQKSDPLVQALKNIGVEARETTFKEIQGKDLVTPEATIIAIKTLDSYVLSVSGHRNQDGFLRRVAAMALVSSAIHTRPMELPEIPEPPTVKPEDLAGMKGMLDHKFFFEKPKPDWPKPNHIRPTAQWKNQQRRNFHPARSR